MKFQILTLFPEFINSLNNYGVIGKALEKGIIDLTVKNIRDYSKDKHNRVDDEIYGGGAGMLMTPQPVYDCIMDSKTKDSLVVYMSPQGEVLDQEKCKELSKYDDIILLCGHYEGIDSRIVDNYVDMELSIGDYVMTGGELAAMVVIDSVSRLVEGVLGNDESAVTDSHYNVLLQNNVYTRPREFNGHKVPEVLFSGNHKKIEEWKKESSLVNTKNKRPDIYEKYIKNNKLK
ncbi:tRNA (guanosine(37)-N1)-methyltransferase TrmD [Miniphocaeibacter massiliensis]|uniref:tRNA (guanosine(37)-N1)-methyltransferase TrmD n=1 Tax=Miniphocaeibacter massiliensis TaxID=2041841 RepID=UPI000C068D1E|nr:tRNA (guanosine(37)-N1)-methyltransferase TrmD [Miniphocaeibacter massiliensis]